MNKFDPNAGDSLDDLFNAAKSDAPVQPRKVNPDYQTPNAFTSTAPARFVEKCRKCRGSGQFVGYTGRVLGQCHECKGKGELTYKTPAASRAKAKLQREERADRQRTQNIESFKQEHPEAYAWMMANGSFEFAVKMLQVVTKYGYLTEKQMAAVERCAGRAAARQQEAAARAAAAPEISIAKIEEAFASARASGLIKLKLRLDTFVFSPAGPSAKWAGSIYVKDGSEYIGRITEGKFFGTRECGEDRQKRVIAAAADPEAAAIAYGKQTGSCSCCGLTLTNPESIARGIGPICSKKFGWG